MHKVIFFLLFGGCLPFAAFAQGPSFPFPHHTNYTTGSIRPDHKTQAQLDSVTAAFYLAWKQEYLVQGCDTSQYYIKFSNGVNICVSEGQGYGMVILAYMAGYDPAARNYFDGLYRWYKTHPSNIDPVLMNWRQKQGCISNGNDAATDGDLDIAYALLLADKQWGSSGTVPYLQEATQLITAIRQSEVFAPTHSTQLGDWAHGDAQYEDDTRPSDFMFDHFRSYASVSGSGAWTSILNECYDLVDSMQTNWSPLTGLLPDFIEDCDGAPHPSAPNFLEGPHDGVYYYNSCRTPWHLGADYLLNGDLRAKNACDKINGWLRTHTSDDISNIRTGYKLDGSNISGNNYQDLSFMAPFAVSACTDASNQTWLNALWDYLTGETISHGDYYGNTIKMLCMLLISGHYWAPQTVTTQVPAAAGNILINGLALFPEPATATVSLRFTLQARTDVVLHVLDVAGRLIRQQRYTSLPEGVNELALESGDLPGGVYYVVLEAGHERIRAALLKR